MTWTFVYLMVGLKIPIAALLYIVWWAIHQTDDTDNVAEDGGSKVPRRPHPRRPRHPRPPRRGGPGCGARLTPPPRTRSVTAAGRARELHQ